MQNVVDEDHGIQPEAPQQPLQNHNTDLLVRHQTVHVKTSVDTVSLWLHFCPLCFNILVFPFSDNIFTKRFLLYVFLQHLFPQCHKNCVGHCDMQTLCWANHQWCKNRVRPNKKWKCLCSNLHQGKISRWKQEVAETTTNASITSGNMWQLMKQRNYKVFHYSLQMVSVLQLGKFLCLSRCLVGGGLSLCVTTSKSADLQT